MRRVLAGAAAFVAAMVIAPAAHGATVSVVDNGFISSLEYDAGPAEANRVDVTYSLDSDGYVATINDRGAVIATTTPRSLSGGTGCTTTGVHQAVCHYLNNSIDQATFQLGDRNDTFTPNGVSQDFNIYGGAGNDQLTGGPGTNWFMPGTGTDKVVGGPGFDHVSYADHTTPVTITVDGQANDGSRGENDSLTGIEEYEGGAGDDTLIGSDGNDRLIGGEGNDLIDGRGGNDELDAAGSGADHIIGGAGQDNIYPGLGGLVDAVDGEADTIYCAGRANDLQTDSIDVLNQCPAP